MRQSKDFWTPERCQTLSAELLRGRSYKDIENDSFELFGETVSKSALADVLRREHADAFKAAVSPEDYEKVQKIVREKQQLTPSRQSSSRFTPSTRYVRPRKDLPNNGLPNGATVRIFTQK